MKIGSIVGCGAALFLAACSQSSPPGGVAARTVASGRCGTTLPTALPVVITNVGKRLLPVGRTTVVGNFPTGGALSPDGRYYWSVSSGHGQDDVHIVDVVSGQVVQVLPLPGAYGAMTFSPDGRTAYVSGEPKGSSTPAGPTMGDAGDVIHVFQIDPTSGRAAEQTPITLPATTGGSARSQGFPPNPNLPSFPVGIAVSPNGKTLLVALYNADQAAIIDAASGNASLVNVGKYPYAAAILPDGKTGYISNAYDGTLSVIDLSSARVIATIAGLGGPDGDANSQPQYLLPSRDGTTLYAAVTNHDGVAVIDTASNQVTRFISLKPLEGYGAQPVSLALSPIGDTLYVAEAGLNAVAAIALTDRADGSAKAFDVIGALPTADYPTDVKVTPDGCTMVWQAARGFGTGANPDYGGSQGPRVNNSTDPKISPYPSYVMDLLIGRVGLTPTPADAAFRALAPVVSQATQPENAQPPPADTPVTAGPDGRGGWLPSDKIKYVFYVVKENRTYDQIFGSDPRGDGDPALEVLGDNGETIPGNKGPAGPGSGVTPNQHALSRMFVLLDRFFEDAEVSLDGHVITSGVYASNFVLKNMHAEYSDRGRPTQIEGVFPVSFPPRDFLFDQAVRDGISFENYGELAGGSSPGVSDDGRSTYAQVIAHSDLVDYPSDLFIGCMPANAPNAPNTPDCVFDAGLGAAPPLAQSRIDAFNRRFQQQLASGNVPQFNYLVMLDDHTNGTTPGARDPLAMCASNDLAVGQLVQIISHSSIWPQSVIFVVEDDSQDGADHVDAHRAPALVIGPYVRHGGAVVHTHYDQYSVIRTIELILGLKPLSLFDAVATPMYAVFTNTPDNTPYTAITPTQDLMAVNPANAANAGLSAALPFDQLDEVPQQISDRILWQRVHGAGSPPPVPGPNASRLEQARADAVNRAWKRGEDLRSLLAAQSAED